MKSVVALILALIPATAVPAQETVHSDLPLFGSRHRELWPTGLVDGDSLGCASRVAFGDWKFVPSAKPGEESNQNDIRWMRISNYGVFHCAAIERWADDPKDLKSSDFKYSWFVKLGETGAVELWALQSGTRPGSDYLLLTRDREGGLIKSFNVLRVECPRGNRRSSEPLDVWGNAYCSINSARELRSLAGRMAKLPPAGTLTFAQPLPEEDYED